MRDWYHGRVQSAQRRRRWAGAPVVDSTPGMAVELAGAVSRRRPYPSDDRPHTQSDGGDEGQCGERGQRDGRVRGKGPEVDRPTGGMVEDRCGLEGPRALAASGLDQRLRSPRLGQRHRHEPDGDRRHRCAHCDRRLPDPPHGTDDGKQGEEGEQHHLGLAEARGQAEGGQCAGSVP